MREIKGNLWEQSADALVITTNGFVKANGAGVMGRGCALEAKTRFPGIDLQLGSMIRAHGNHVGVLVDGITCDIVSFPVKWHWRDEARLYLIARSAEELVELANERKYGRVVLPRPGCGNGRLSWDFVKPVVRRILDSRFEVITYG